jgi:hypothetical protein
VYVRDSKNIISYQGKPIWGPDHTSTLDTVNNLSILYAGQRKLDGAEKMYRRALPGGPRSHINIFQTNFTTVESHASWDQVPKDIESFSAKRPKTRRRGHPRNMDTESVDDGLEELATHPPPAPFGFRDHKDGH